jgi:hypothetical protein
MGSFFNARELEKAELYLCDALVDALKRYSTHDIQIVLNVLNIAEIPEGRCIHLFQKLSAYKDMLILLIEKGLNPSYVCSGISKMENFNQELLIFVLKFAKTNNLEAKFFSPSAIRNIVDGEKGMPEHALETLKVLDEHGISLHLENEEGEGFEYYGKNAKEIVILLLKHGCPESSLLYDIGLSGSNFEAIKYLIVERGTRWNDKGGNGTLLQHVSFNEECSPELLRFLVEDLKIPTGAPDGNSLPFDMILDHAINTQCIEYMLSVDAPFTKNIEALPFEKRMLFAVDGKVKIVKAEGTLLFFEKLWINWLKQTIAKICDCKILGREVYQPDQEPVWDPEYIDFRKVPLNYFLDAVHLFCHGSYHENHPYYQKVVDLYGKKPGFHRDVSKKTMDKLRSNLKTISTLLQWSPFEREMLGDEAERNYKRIKINK